ncbi:MAG: hypothetical protein QF864_04310 [SAR202 cluster bacterium]|nr:hypothetical protein [SAR202 cluster bacterium]
MIQQEILQTEMPVPDKDPQQKKKNVRPIVESIVSIQEYRRLYKEFSGMFPDDNFYESYRIALEKGVRKPNRTKSKVARKLKRKIQAASRKMNTGTKGHTALR